jgi:hypothetical protein
MRWFLIFLTSFIGAAAELPVPSDVIVEKAIDYASIPHGKLAMDIVRPKPPASTPRSC